MEVTRACLEEIERLENTVVRDLDVNPTTVPPFASQVPCNYPSFAAQRALGAAASSQERGRAHSECDISGD